MSLIPKVTIPVKKSKSHFNVGSYTHGTSEIGFVLPSYSRNVKNDSTVKIGTRSVIRLSSLFVPTMGDLSLRHYHCFVPFNKIWTPFDAFLDKKPFAFSSGYSAVPTRIPSFKVGDLLKYLMQGNIADFDTTHVDSLRDSLVCTMYYVRSGGDSEPAPMDWGTFNLCFDDLDNNGHSAKLDNVFNQLSSFRIQEGSNYTYGGIPSVLNIPIADTGFPVLYTFSGSPGSSGMQYNVFELYPEFALSGQRGIDRYRRYRNNLSYPTYLANDFMDCFDVGDYRIYMCYNFNHAWKRLRSVFLGLGYCFNPFDNQPVTPLKLLAFYRCYWNKFGVNRNFNFQDTNCALVTREISNMANGSINCNYGSTFYNFVDDLTRMTYTTPADYFSSSVLNTQQSLLDNSGSSMSLTSLQGNAQSGHPQNITAVATAGSTDASNIPAGAYLSSNSTVVPAIGIEMALKLLRWINRRTVVGSAIYDGLRSLYGNIEVNDESTEGVIRIGEDSTTIEIGAIYNQTDFISQEQGAPLGSFAGVGVGKNGKSRYYKFDTPSFGCIITMTAVVPQMGYFQGMLRENSDGTSDSYEMFDPSYDAVGWQTVRYNELVADKQFKQSPAQNTNIGTNLGIFGAQPRYTHMKVGFNRVLGDISLPHMQDSMLAYTLDRFFPQREVLPVNSPQSFRAATQGNTNRIFQVTSPTDDHVIWQVYFDVDLYMSMKTISESYDLRNGDETGSFDVSHQ